MKRIAICAGLVAAAVAVPAQAHGPNPHPAKSHAPKAKHCAPHAVGYNASGTLVSSTLTQTQGVGTETLSDDRYSGDLQVDVKKANHKAPTGVQTFTLTDARVGFYDANGDHVADVPKAGDRVKLHGKVTKLRHRCDPTGFTPTITVNRVRFKLAQV